ncbi:MAG: oxygen-dependent coproporphyrinogen oxidase [Proteobacteria bacterium]|nr:oxygen-dependent coproporphyrinogen oxidase [Pseudomonadota bacterium]
MTTADMPERAIAYFQDLQNRICARFESLDGVGRFEKTPWQKEPDSLMQGGGEMRVMKGDVFEKVGVNFSHVHGRFSDEFAPSIPGASKENPQFWASGVSLVAHMRSPLVPAVHMNVRRIVTTKAWFGGGADLTPYFPFEEDTQSFHTHLKAACDSYRPDAYAEYKAWCDRYFFLPHRNEPRGVGGIFFDNLESGSEEADFAFVQAVGDAFLTAYADIVARRKDLPWTPEQREHQLVRRGRYVEFNLLYDRGTLFGLKTNGNTEAILMSMPPEVKWP